jgi:hypothetical protein
LFKKIIAGAGIALVALFAAPAAAQAVYAPDESIIVTGTPAPGEEIAVTFDEVFTPGEQVSFQVTGSGTATLAVFKAATVGITKTADAAGTAVVDVTLPADATGTYTVTATGLTSGIVGTAAVTVVAADGSGAGDEDGDGLAVTGGTALTTIWIAAGALALGVVLLLVRGMRRKATV